VQSLDQALREGWRPPAKPEPHGAMQSSPLYAVSAETLTDKTALRSARRADRFSKMTVLAAADALRDSGISPTDNTRVGIVTATAFGPHVTTFRFLDDLLDFGDKASSPTTFSHSVHNAAASYVASALDLRGPTLTITQFGFLFHEALLIARTWLDEDRCDHVLAGVVDEVGSVMAHIAGRKLRIAADGRIRPFDFASAPAAVPGEGSIFFLLSQSAAAEPYCRVSSCGRIDAAPAAGSADLQIVAADGLAPDESAYRAGLAPAIPAAGYAPLTGSFPGGDAFACAAGALALRRQTRYASPVTDNPHGIPLCTKTETGPLREVLCAKQDCAGGLALTRLCAL
jgi:3-oxoacyl-[acyl-carrier-protein] synthase II